MTRKDYIRLENAMQTVRATWIHTTLTSPDMDDGAIALWNLTVKELADTLTIDNPRFNREAWFSACGLPWRRIWRD